MLTAIGILIVVLAVIALFLKKIFADNKLLNWFDSKHTVQFVGIGLLMTVITGMFFYA